MLPTRRDLRFDLPAERIRDWHGQGPYVTHFMNTLSLFFPVGERFFIHAVRQYRDEVSDPGLRDAVTAFIGQEAMHGREHEEYNRHLQDAGYPAERMEQAVFELLEFIKRRTPRSTHLSATIALEHFTAMMANQLLANDGVVGASEPHYARLWRWHALEETEHKAVAYDVWDQVEGRGLRAYLGRTSGLVLATVIFWGIVAPYYLRMVDADPELPRGWRARLEGHAGTLRYLFGEPGPLRKLVPEWFDYFRRDFHPWDHDNRAYLEQIDEIVAEVA